jgi:hypothetical protein
MKVRSDLDGALFNWKEKGYEAKLIGDDEIDGTLVYHIEVKLSDGMKKNYFIDKENYVIIQESLSIIAQGQEVVQDDFPSNYDMQDDMLFAFEKRSFVNGQLSQSIIIEKIEFGGDKKDAFFSISEKK